MQSTKPDGNMHTAMTSLGGKTPEVWSSSPSQPCMADLLQVISREPGGDLVVDDGAHVTVRSFIVVFVCLY